MAFVVAMRSCCPTGGLEGEPGGFDAAPTCLPGLLVEAPAGRGVEEAELSFHAFI
jgi:hypothetical protein